jgi:hypothetical protein
MNISQLFSFSQYFTYIKFSFIPHYFPIVWGCIVSSLSSSELPGLLLCLLVSSSSLFYRFYYLASFPTFFSPLILFSFQHINPSVSSTATHPLVPSYVFAASLYTIHKLHRHTIYPTPLFFLPLILQHVARCSCAM